MASSAYTNVLHAIAVTAYGTIATLHDGSAAHSYASALVKHDHTGWAQDSANQYTVLRG